ncbi:unnamed protein product [Medioppia subpectinata]|uniref:Uncharacterized protein n=1 Tax=Medioppia subpectinata TaxID=1979941 RepID=A0A7R9KR79_9ACAR|nr:unnamed protein product [Medioppia subpectinata]CAG2107111.1 unnamed protein product [Medioppia subpectinata]
MKTPTLLPYRLTPATDAITRSTPKHQGSLSEESDRKCRELCEEMSALKASNESEVKALKAQLNTALDSMQTMTEEMNALRQQLSSYTSNQEVVTKLSELSIKNSAISEEISALKANYKCEMKVVNKN